MGLDQVVIDIESDVVDATGAGGGNFGGNDTADVNGGEDREGWEFIIRGK